MKKVRIQLFAMQICSLLLILAISSFFFDRTLMLTEERQNYYLQSSLSQAAQGVESVLNEIQLSTENYAYSAAVQELLRLPGRSSSMLYAYNLAKNSAYTILSINHNIDGFAILPLEGGIYTFGLKDQYRYLNALQEAHDLPESKFGIFRGRMDRKYGENQAYYVYFLPVYSTTQNQEAALGEYLGLCAAFCRKSALAEVMRAALMDGMSIELHSAEGTILEVKQNAPSGVQTKLLTNTYAYPSLEWTMIQRYFSPQFSSPYPLIFTAFLLIALCVLALLSLIIHRNFIRPITELNAELLRLSDDPLAAQKLNIACPNEFNTIAHSIKVLLEQLLQSHHKQVEQQTHMLRVELSMNQLQLALLQSQINPHFLYNTLACIRGIALENNVRVIAELVTNMATLYRYSIKGGAYVQLSSELEIIQRYLYIMNLRMDNKFRVRMEIPEQLKSCWIAKMILQPLVENAIFHGLECSENGGEIRIYATWFEGDNAFLLNVYDNGEGIEQKTVNRLNELFQQMVGGSDAQQLNAKGVGMLNVHRKIRLHHGDAYGLHVESEKGKFTRVCALLPVLEQCPEHNEKA